MARGYLEANESFPRWILQIYPLRSSFSLVSYTQEYFQVKSDIRTALAIKQFDCDWCRLRPSTLRNCDWHKEVELLLVRDTWTRFLRIGVDEPCGGKVSLRRDFNLAVQCSFQLFL